MMDHMNGLIAPRTPWEAFLRWATDAVRGSLGLPPLMWIA